ncbi:MAG TPA: hypothetical protein VF179_21830, partial [Thermoanaerobaculia bacterium]|nr:hypothetical protein [Thermoanaerobaculia bacterium]
DELRQLLRFRRQIFACRSFLQLQALSLLAGELDQRFDAAQKLGMFLFHFWLRRSWQFLGLQAASLPNSKLG